MRRSRAVALALICGLILAACGARLNPQTRQQAANALLNANGGTGTSTGTGTSALGGGTTGPATTTGGGSTTTGGGSTTTGGGGSTTGGGGSTTTGGGGSTTTGGSSGTSCPKSGTDVGLTSNSVTLGVVASTTGPVSGLFQGALQGMQAYRAYANSQGGICGHAVNIQFADDGTNCGQNQNDTQNLASKVFAFVGSFSLYDGCSADYFKSNPDIPDLHVQLDPRAVEPKNHYDIEPGALGYATGMFETYAKMLGSKVKSVGTLYPNIPSAVDKQHAFVKSANSAGWTFVYSRAGDAQETDWTQDFVKMCQQQHIQIFYTSAENAANEAKMLQDEDSAGCPSSLINIIPIAYDAAFIQDAGSSKRLEGLMGWNEYSLFFNQDEAAQIPELKLFQGAWQAANGSAPMNLYGFFAWAEARLFQQAFESAGSTITRKTLLAALAKITKYDDHGGVGVVNPGSKSDGVYCYVLWKYSGGAFHRFQDPASGFRCDGRFLQLGG
jgi:ABC-type branched-subunit amino acid transport system substrate-binding protein